MKVENLTAEQLDRCIAKLNKVKGYKIEYNRHPERNGNYLHFTIKSEVSKIPGARTSSSGRNLVSASWHAHGYLFDIILTEYPDAVIKSLDSKIYSKNGHVSGNWQDRNIGSIMEPCYFSETSIL